MEGKQPTISDGELELFRTTPTPYISDAMDTLGLANVRMWGILPIVPFKPARHIAGPAVTLRFLPSHNADALARSPFNRARIINESAPGSILVIESRGNSALGERYMAIAKKAGLQGCIADGPTRDIDEVKTMYFPLMVPGGGGMYGIKMEGHMTRLIELVGHNVPVWVEAPGRPGALVRPGDVMVGDNNGAIVIPRAYVSAVVEKTREVIANERKMAESALGESDR